MYEIVATTLRTFISPRFRLVIDERKMRVRRYDIRLSRAVFRVETSLRDRDTDFAAKEKKICVRTGRYVRVTRQYICKAEIDRTTMHAGTRTNTVDELRELRARNAYTLSTNISPLARSVYDRSRMFVTI